MSYRLICLAACLLLSLGGCGRPAVKSDVLHGAAAAEAQRGEWWMQHYTYPTGRFDPAWVRSAEREARVIPQALPVGRLQHPKAAGGLPADRLTALGPAPLNSPLPTSGRFNALIIAPTPRLSGDPGSFVAFAGSAGGGIWKTDNCCSAATSWRVVSDTAAVGSTAIGALAFDPNDANVIYAGTGDHRFGSFSFGSVGLLQSRDGGETWKTLADQIFTPPYPVNETGFSQYQAISAVVVDPQDSRRLLVGSKTGLFISHDGGQNFSGPCLSNPHGGQRQDVTGLLLLPAGNRQRILLAVGVRGNATPVQPSLDNNGANGIYAADLPASGCPVGWQLVSRPDTVWPIGLGNGQALGPVGRIELTAAPSAPNVVYAELVSSSDYQVLGIWRSTDGGLNWQQRAATADFFGCRAPGNQNWYNAWIRVDPNDPDRVYLGAFDVFRSDDGGAGFVNLFCDPVDVHPDQHAAAFVGGDSSRAVFANDGGLYFSDSLQLPVPDFVPVNTGLNAIEFYAGDLTADFANTSPRGMIGAAQDNGTSVLVQSGDFDAAGWTQIRGADGISARIEPVLGQRWYFASQRGALVLSTDGPNSAEVSGAGEWNPGAEGPERKSFLMPLDLYKYGALNEAGSGCTANAGCTHLLTGSYRVWESVNGALGATAAQRWAPISADLTRNSLIVGGSNRSYINQVSYATSDRRFALVATSDGKVWRGGDLGNRPSTAIWRDLTDNNRILPNRSVADVVSDPTRPDIGYAAVAGFAANTPLTPGHVFQFRCNNDCASVSWIDKTGNLPDIPANSIIVNPWLPAQVLVGTDLGLYFTDNIESGSPQWRRFSGFPPVMVWDMTIDRGFTTLAVFTRSRGAWVWPLPRAAEKANLTGFWYNAAEPGWGLSIAQQGNVLVPIWYTYDRNGKPIWYLVSGATEQNDGSYSGPVFRFNGTPFDRISGPANQPGTEVGVARFSLDAQDRLSFSYTLDGVSQSRLTSRFAAGPPPACHLVTSSRAAAGNRSDLWWNPGQSGWGLQLTESGSQIFAIWYTYGIDQQPMWVTASLSRQADGSFRGVLNRPLQGVPFAQISGAPATSFPVPAVGTATLRFVDGERGSFSTTLDGIEQTRPIERIVFAGPGLSVCE